MIIMATKIMWHVDDIIVDQAPKMVKIWFKLTKLQSEIALFRNIFSKTVILPILP